MDAYISYPDHMHPVIAIRNSPKDSVRVFNTTPTSSNITHVTLYNKHGKLVIAHRIGERVNTAV